METEDLHQPKTLVDKREVVLKEYKQFHEEPHKPPLLGVEMNLACLTSLPGSGLKIEKLTMSNSCQH